jgi:hypothetical protein
MTWNQVRKTLAKWRKNPAIHAEPGVIEPLTDAALLRARFRAIAGRETGETPPTRVVADPNGGIVFEWENEREHREWHVWEDGMWVETVVR